MSKEGSGQKPGPSCQGNGNAVPVFDQTKTDPEGTVVPRFSGRDNFLRGNDVAVSFLNNKDGACVGAATKTTFKVNRRKQGNLTWCLYFLNGFGTLLCIFLRKDGSPNGHFCSPVTISLMQILIKSERSRWLKMTSYQASQGMIRLFEVTNQQCLSCRMQTEERMLPWLTLNKSCKHARLK